MMIQTTAKELLELAEKLPAGSDRTWCQRLASRRGLTVVMCDSGRLTACREAVEAAPKPVKKSKVKKEQSQNGDIPGQRGEAVVDLTDRAEGETDGTDPGPGPPE